MSGLNWGIVYDETLTGDLVYADLGVTCVVTVSDHTVPVTGLEAGTEAWSWDRRRLERTSTREHYGTYVGGQVHGLQERTKQTDWISGSVQGIALQGVNEWNQEGLVQWVPQVTTGKYLALWEERRLYSDYSLAGVVDEVCNSFLSRATLDSDHVLSTVDVAIWRRTDTGLIMKQQDYKYVDAFSLAFDGTGAIETVASIPTAGAELATFASTLEPRIYEWMLVNNTIAVAGWGVADYAVMNQEAVIHIGAETVAVANIDLGKAFEYKGRGNGQSRDLYTQFFPVVDTTVRVISLLGGVQIEWTRVADFSATTTEHHFIVDEDLGIITLSGYSTDDLYLESDISETATILYAFESLTLEQYLETGVLVIGTEEIQYRGRDGNCFVDLVRGYNATVAVPHSRGEVFQLRTEGYAAIEKEQIYIAYDAVPRIEYEVRQDGLRSANKATKVLNIKPTANPESNSVLQIATTLYNLESLTLTSSSALIGGNLFGPVYFGTDTSRLTVQALDSAGNPVEDLEITLVLEGAGLLNSDVSPYSAISNQLGEIYSIYSAPYNASSVQYPVIETLNVGPDTTMEVSGLPDGVGVEDITVFQILKHDPSVGTIGTTTTVESSAVIAAPYGLTRLTLGIRLDESYEGGVIYILGTDLVRYRRDIGKVWDTTIIDGITDVPVSMIDLAEGIDSTLTVGQQCWVLRPDEVSWDAVEMNGAKVLLYEWRIDVEHPLTGDPGAWFPLEPDSIDADLLTFNSRTIGIPAPFNDSNNLGGYLVICKTIATLWAYARDPVSGRLVTSNRIRLLVDLPQYLRGVDRSGALPIPYGFRFKTEEHNVGAGLGGSNFITVNPSAEGINQFSIYVEV